MHIISRKKLLEFTEKHAGSQLALDVWYRKIKCNSYLNLAELRATFPSADLVRKYTVFNIGGNKFRLIAVIIYEKQRVYIRDVLTHDEYNKNKWLKQFYD